MKKPSNVLSLTWIALLALTTGSYVLSEIETGAAALMALSFFKLLLISAVFMELRHCRPLFLRSALGLYALTLIIIVSTS